MVDHAERVLDGRYRLLERIGSGGMGTVWRARDEVLHREVAVKEIRFPHDVTDETRAMLRERALREARAAARLDHPGIVDVHDVLTDDDSPWIIMRFVRGRSLEQVVREDGPLDPRRVAEIGLALLGALGAAHAQRILHRDVKPANVLVGSDGRVLLTDFGIASMGDAPQLTRTGAMIGSPAYMAPERLHGDRPGEPSDLWALGATLYHAIEGRAPYTEQELPVLIGAVLTREPAPPQRAGALGPILYGLLVKDPARRLSAGDARRRLEDLLAAPAGPAAAVRGAAAGAGPNPGAGAPPATMPPPAAGTAPAAGFSAGVRRAFDPPGPTAPGAGRRPHRNAKRGAVLVAVVIGVLALNTLRVLATTLDEEFSTTRSCQSIVEIGDETQLLPGNPDPTASPACVWRAASSGTVTAQLSVRTEVSARRLFLPFTGKSGGQMAHARFESLRRTASGDLAEALAIGREAFTATVALDHGVRVMLDFRVSNLVVTLWYERTSRNGSRISAADARTDLEGYADSIAASLDS